MKGANIIQFVTHNLLGFPYMYLVFFIRHYQVKPLHIVRNMRIWKLMIPCRELRCFQVLIGSMNKIALYSSILDMLINSWGL